MQVAVIGSRKGASRSDVEGFVRSMYAKDPTIILVSGGAEGPDKWAEEEWMRLGGRVLSYRVVQEDLQRYAIEVWKLGSWDTVMQYRLNEEPTWADRQSALFYRDCLIAENSDKVCAFFAPGRRTPGTQTTLDFAYAYGRDCYEYFANAA